MAADDEHHFEYRSALPPFGCGRIYPARSKSAYLTRPTAGDDSLREGLATFLHERHPKTTQKSGLEIWGSQYSRRVLLNSGRTPVHLGKPGPNQISPY